MPKQKKSQKQKTGKKSKKSKKNSKKNPEAKKSKTITKSGPVAIRCQTNRYPGILQTAVEIAIVRSQFGRYTEICYYLHNAFKDFKRVLLMTPWANYAIYKEFNGKQDVFYLYDSCSCTMNILRYFDLSKGTAGFLYFQTMHEVIKYVLDNRFKCEKFKILLKTKQIEKICNNFCTQGGEDIYKVCNIRGEIVASDEYLIKQCVFPKDKKTTCCKMRSPCTPTLFF